MYPLLRIFSHPVHGGNDLQRFGEREEPRQATEEGHDPILGLDNVALDLPLAGLGSRLLAVALDLVAISVLAALAGLGLALLVSWVELSAGWAMAIFVVALFVLQFGYFAICEVATGGSTPGKSMVGLRTVSSLGGKPSAGAVLVRNFLRAFDFLFGWVLIAVDSRRRRIGDLVAGTLVVHLRPESPDAVRLGRVPPSWGSREIAVVESFLARAGRMEAERARDLGGRLVAWMRRREPELTGTPAPRPDEDPVELLHRWLETEAA